ncbi:hypothetical protein AFIC_002714 [[Pseudomonas] carboxydohydrogena]|uniref:Uncharacterized protein n=1 Tax=Afipia carboxydohydrogena TaxID=290 RepID=A0ABY8BMD3_AFICR|nr:hypothetical protein [[Pseudomonas] carboxydohydrogena]WEF51144.1 hypothetical protein AFIC_002714 [[Pseudomonas] carboxydohydrogena]
MKIPVIFVAVSLAAAILVLASLLILTRADSSDTKILGSTALTAPGLRPSQPFWKMKNAPTAMKAKPTA